MIHITIKCVVLDKGKKKKKDPFSALKIQQEILKRSKKVIENMLVSFCTTLREETLIYS